MPIAANITPKTFTYGEFLIKKGEVPPGLIYIVEGQCKVVAKKIGQRDLIDNRQGHTGKEYADTKKLGIDEPALHEFNPQTSILNQVNSMQRGYQNARVLIND